MLLASTLFELTQTTDDPKLLEDILSLANEYASLVERHTTTLHPDLGQSLVEYILFTIDDVKAHTPPRAATLAYKNEVTLLLKPLNKRS